MPLDDLEEWFECNEPMITLNKHTMECTVVTSEKGQRDLYYGRPLFSWEDTLVYEVPESLVNEIRDCPTEEIQNVIYKIVTTCNQILTGE